MGKKKYDYNFARELFLENGYELLETEYLGYSKSMRFRCPNHPNDETKIVFSVLLKGGRCKKCADEDSAKNRRLSIDKVRKEFNDKNYTLLEENYTNNTTLMSFICRNHDFEIQKVKYMNFKVSNNSCKYCCQEKMSERFREDIDTVREVFLSKNYTLLDNDYKNAHKKLKYICNKHPDEIQEARYNNVKYNITCRFCDEANREISNQGRRHSFEFVKEQFEECGYTLLDKEYINCETKMYYICNNHPNHINSVTFDKFYNEGTRCPKCKESKGEKVISEELDANNIKYISQYTFDECVNEKKLPFDFAIFKNDELKLLIEYQGEQHFKPIEFFGGYEKFLKQQYNDKIKKEFCINNNIQLVEIPYWEFDNIKKIIRKTLNNV